MTMLHRTALAAALILSSGAAKAEDQGPYRPLTSYRLAITSAAASTASAPIGSQTRIVRIICSVNCLFAFPISPIVSAATVPVYLRADELDYFRVSPGTYVHGYAKSTSGTIYITEVGK